MLLHRRAAADPSIAFELRAGDLILALPDNCIESVPSIFPSTDESMWQMI
jgi:hypothetical protein